MRVMQIVVLTNWMTQSGNPAQSAHAFFGGDSGDILVDTSFGCRSYGIGVRNLDERNGLLFVAKDVDTLIGGFKHLERHIGRDPEFSITTMNGTPLSIAGIKWDLGSTRYKNPLAAGILTAVHNMKAHITHKDHLQSISGNMRKAGRDGRLLQAGAAVYLASATAMPTRGSSSGQYKWYAAIDCGIPTTMESLAAATKSVFGR